MPLISNLLDQIRNAEITINVINDSRGVSPGGTMVVDLVRGHRCFATLLIRTLHPAAREQFGNINHYRVTEVSIDNAEVILIRQPTTAAELWAKLNSLLRERHNRAKEALSRLPNSNESSHSRRPERSEQPHPSQAGCYQQPPYSRRYKQKHRRRFPDHFYRSQAA